MNILFLTLVGSENINERGIYNDLMRKFRDNGHNVFIVSPYERRFNKKTKLFDYGSIKLLKIWTPNIQKTSIFEKGLTTLILENIFLKGIKKYFPDISFDLILYSTPPITFTKVIKYIKKRDNAKTYLLLKDIFPQNAVDIGLIKKNSIIHKFFRRKEKELYRISDTIGCMSLANVEYVIKNNQELDKNKIEVNPNSITPINIGVTQEEIRLIRKKYGIPLHSVLFVYGGNLGLPQGIDFLIDVLNDQKNKLDVYFAIIGSGTMFSKLKKWFDMNLPLNAKLYSQMPKSDYDNFLNCSDVGMIFLDKRFTIPNFPSRLLSYLEMKKPVILATDKNTDIGRIAEKNNFGLWSENGDLNTFTKNINKLKTDPVLRKEMGMNGYNYLLENYTTEHSYSIIMKHFENVH